MDDPLPEVNVQVQNGNGVLIRLVVCLKCMELAYLSKMMMKNVVSWINLPFFEGSNAHIILEKYFIRIAKTFFLNNWTFTFFKINSGEWNVYQTFFLWTRSFPAPFEIQKKLEVFLSPKSFPMSQIKQKKHALILILISKKSYICCI